MRFRAKARGVENRFKILTRAARGLHIRTPTRVAWLGLAGSWYTRVFHSQACAGGYTPNSFGFHVMSSLSVCAFGTCLQ